MADGTKIEWTDATWNPITGCAVVSPGCTNCYAMKLAGTRLKHIASRKGLTQPSKAGPVWTGEVRFNEEMLDQPLRWKRPRMIFVCAHGDLFAENVPDEWIDKVFAVMALAPQHTFQCLSKRPERMREYLSGRDAENGFPMPPLWHIGMTRDDPSWQDTMDWPLPNVWLGVSVEDQTRAEERIPLLLDTPAAVRWISAEPLLGPVDLTDICTGNYFTNPLTGHRWHDAPEGVASASDMNGAKLDWVVAGGESGQGARPMHPDWARSLRDQCAAAGVAFHFKQWGEWSPIELQFEDDDHADGAAYAIEGCCDNPEAHNSSQECLFRQDDRWVHWPHVRANSAIGVRRIGKAAAGRTLDGITHDAYPTRERA
jgi:protein gp37